MTTKTNNWPAYQKRWEFKGTAEEAVIFSGANGGYESRMQYEFMLAQGLKPGHRFLDLGCGALRGTIRLVDYLLDGNFYGADISIGLLKEALIECGRIKTKNTPILQLMDSFEIPFDEKFDFIPCNSVTVHVEPEDIGELLSGIKRSLAPTGKAFVSIYPLLSTAPEPFYWDNYRWWYKPSWIYRAGQEAGIEIKEMPGKITNRIPGQRKPIIPIVNTNMTEWMMEGTL